MDGSLLLPETSELPDWMPENVRNYLTHTIRGVSIRELARQQGCHASTIMRQVRRVEARRDDPLIEDGLTRLGAAMEEDRALTPCDDVLSAEAIRVLRRLCEAGSVLAIAEGMQNGVVMRGVEEGDAGLRTAVVPVDVAQAMALCDWLSCAAAGKISRYRVSAAGRAALGQLMAANENRARSRNEGFAEAQTPFARPGGKAAVARPQPIQAESPLIALSRRRDRDGNRFLDEAMVRAGERLREDYELSQMNDTGNPAKDRLTDALEELGPGLADVALRCCCHLEGLESTEQRMGWSARSGKIVLRIALQRLGRFYELRAKQGGDMIG